MADVRVILSGLWVAVMLTYLLGDVLRVFAGDITPGQLGGRKASQRMWLGIAVIMLIPIIMVVLSLTLPYPAIGWVNIVVAVLVVVFNLFGLPYAGLYDNFLILVSFVFNALIQCLERLDVGLHSCLAQLLKRSRGPGCHRQPGRCAPLFWTRTVNAEGPSRSDHAIAG